MGHPVVWYMPKQRLCAARNAHFFHFFRLPVSRCINEVKSQYACPPPVPAAASPSAPGLQPAHHLAAPF
jgi:hypothetical protein